LVEEHYKNFETSGFIGLTENGGPENEGPKQTNDCDLKGVPVQY